MKMHPNTRTLLLLCVAFTGALGVAIVHLLVFPTSAGVSILVNAFAAGFWLAQIERLLKIWRRTRL